MYNCSMVPSAFKATTAGLIGGSAALAMGESFNTQVRLGGLTMSAPTAVGVSAAAGSIVNDLVGSWVLQNVPNGQYARIATDLAVSGGTTAAVLNFAPQAAPGSVFASAIVGAGSYLLADQITHKVFGPSPGGDCIDF